MSAGRLFPKCKKPISIDFPIQEVHLPEVKGKASVILATEESGKAFSFWHNPVIYAAGKKIRGVILISVDTLRADHLQTYGYGRKTSPNLDLLAADGVTFERTYAFSSWTLPSHVSLLTSLFNVNHGVFSPNDKMDESLMTITELLRLNGFATYAVP